MKTDFLNALQLDENHERECKLAEGGLPDSIWETYSAFANTDGGTILLGVREHRDSFTVNGLTDKQITKYQKNFWSVLNDRNKISKNILLNHHVKVVECEGKKLLEIDVPAADRHDKPVYVGTDPMRGTYRRDYEGDFLCTEASVRAMFADQQDISVDSKILEDMELDALNSEAIRGYRVLFEQLHNGHPWNKLMTDEFLIKLKAAAKNKKGTVSPTIAGILMFGDADRITDVFPDYFLDYREECDEQKVRWLYRTHSNEGDWSGNVFDFFYKVTTRIDDDVAVPFVNRRNGVRVDRVDVHAALGEAVANALVHSNYYGRRGIVIIKHGKKISISNPGTIRISKEEFYAGGNSDPRNPNLLKMFNFVNIGERAGSGVDKIMAAWKEQQWEKPTYEISLRAERVTLHLKVGQVVYIPEAADLRTVNETFKYRENEIDATETSVILPGLDRVATKEDEAETKGNKVATKEDEVETKVNKVATKEDEVETNRKKFSMKEKLSEEELMILHMVSENAFITQRELHEKTGISLGTVKRILPRLQEKGVLIRDGGKRFGKWIITKE